MNAVKTDVIIPAYHPGEEFDKLLERLSAQKYPVNKIIVMNTEKKFWRENWEQKYPLVEVTILQNRNLIMVQQEEGEQSFRMRRSSYL